MSNKKSPISDWEWDGVVNKPERQAAADLRYANDLKDRAEKEDILCRFYEKNEQRRKSRVEIEACRYSIVALVAGVFAYLVGSGGIAWLAWVLGIVAAVAGLISSYGFGKLAEMGKAKKRATSRGARPEDGMQKNTYIDTVTEEEDEVNAENLY